MSAIATQVRSLFGQAMGKCSCNLHDNVSLTEQGANIAVKEQVARNIEMIWNLRVENTAIASWGTIQDAIDYVEDKIL